MEKGFWHDRLEINLTETIPSQYQLLEQTGRLDNFRRVAGVVNKPYQGYVFNDSDVYKWLEGAAWSLDYDQNESLLSMIDQVVGLIIDAQDKDGYLNTYFSLDKIRQRWTDLSEKHELYCAGHLIQAAIAHYRVTGKYRLLNVALRLADHIYTTFGPSQVDGTGGHPNIEMALIELYRTTREAKYLKQAEIFINRRGHGLLSGSKYLIDHVPFRDLNYLTGHAVRALYLCSGATDLAIETGETTLIDTLERLWTTMVDQQMYITGGIGARYDGEAFGNPFELPNARAYAETCAAIANVMWNWRMLQLLGSARYADLLEWALYNAILPGISMSGNEYFYVNPLKNNGEHRRKAWFDCACCPPNICRTLAMFPGYMYSTSDDGIWLHLYASSKVEFELENQQIIVLKQITSYPWDGQIAIEIMCESPSDSSGGLEKKSNGFSLYFRIPAWVGSQNASIRINSKLFRRHISPGSYLEIHRNWRAGDRIDLDLPMNARFLESHPMVAENTGRITLVRGPLVYCLEEADNPDVDFSQIRVETLSQPQTEYIPDLLAGITRLHFKGSILPTETGWDGKLYR
ncbi:MAG: beta-L-arabinofuranosidase domain-containing protein, partial [Anaerolineales bacterium]